MNNWEYLARLDKANIQIIGLAYDYDDNARGWADDSRGKAPINVRDKVLDRGRLQGTWQIRGIEKAHTEEARP